MSLDKEKGSDLMKKRLKTLAVTVATAGLLVACQSPATSEESTSAAEGTQETSQADVVSTTVSSDITEAVDKANDSVVTVINLQTANMDDFGLWGVVPNQGEEESGESGDSESSDEDLAQAGTGSGVIYKAENGDAYVVTNNHVVEGSDGINVQFADGSVSEAELVGADVWTDLAVLRIPDDNVTTVAEFGDSDALTVGETAIAIGSPLGTDYAATVTAGIISAKDRSVAVDINADSVPDWETQVLQTDAAINPGNSGGALVNIAGQVIGINSMKIASEGVEGIGFAIPSNDVMQIAEQLETNGEVIRPYLGISLLDLAYVSEEQQSQVLNLPEDVEGGIVVADVQPRSPADRGGLEANDVIVSFGGQPVNNNVELRQQIYSTEIGQDVEVEFYRDGELQSTTLTMQSQETEIQ